MLVVNDSKCRVSWWWGERLIASWPEAIDSSHIIGSGRAASAFHENVHTLPDSERYHISSVWHNGNKVKSDDLELMIIDAKIKRAICYR